MDPDVSFASSLRTLWGRLCDRKDRAAAWTVASVLLAAEACLGIVIISFVPYTKIDWDAYMSQVEGFLAGERDYRQLRGDTGPLVYPAGFLYAFTLLRWLTAGDVLPAQYFFLALYLMNLAIVLAIYTRTDLVPPLFLPLLCLSRRVHSIFLLRLFNDCLAMLLAHAALLLLQAHLWLPAVLLFSAGVSVKMNVLLFLPALLLVLAKSCRLPHIAALLAAAVALQALLAWPFVAHDAGAYLQRSFELGRVFIHHWSVNFKFVPEDVFVSKPFALSLLALHLLLLLAFGNWRWARNDGGLFPVAWRMLASLWRADSKVKTSDLTPFYIGATMFSANFIGILCARSLHYQFFCWYFFSVPFLLWLTPFPTAVRLLLFCVLEFLWNVFPSTPATSIALLLLHLSILVGLWLSPHKDIKLKDD